MTYGKLLPRRGHNLYTCQIHSWSRIVRTSEQVSGEHEYAERTRRPGGARRARLHPECSNLCRIMVPTMATIRFQFIQHSQRLDKLLPFKQGIDIGSTFMVRSKKSRRGGYHRIVQKLPCTGTHSLVQFRVAVYMTDQKSFNG